MTSSRLAIDGGTPLAAHSYHEVMKGKGRTRHGKPEPVRRLTGRNSSDEAGLLTLKFERQWVSATGSAHAIACRSGALAARLAMVSLGIGDGDEVLFPAGTYFASPETPNGATVIPVDIDPLTLQIDVSEVEAAITPRTKAIIAADLYGTTPDYRGLRALGEQHGIAIVEDATDSMGAAYGGMPAGSLGTVSFCSLDGAGPISISGGGGVFATDHYQQALEARRFLLGVNDADDVERYSADVASVVGWSYQLPSDHAAEALSQLTRLERAAAVRGANGRLLSALMVDIAGVWVPELVPGATHVYSSFPVLVQPDELGMPESMAPALRDTVRDCIRSEGVWVDCWSPEPIGGHNIWDTSRPDNVTAELDLTIGGGPEQQSAEALGACGLVLGRQHSPFSIPHNSATMQSIAECWHKVMVEHGPRVRDLACERHNLMPSR